MDSSINNINTISVGYPQSISGDTPEVKPSAVPPAPVAPPASPEPALDELRKLSRDLMAIRVQVDKHFQGSKTSQEWEMIGVVIDRLLFGLYIVFIIVSFITIVCIWMWSNSFAV